MIINISGTNYNTTDKYSWKDFSGRKLMDADDLEDTVIYGSCFSQELPEGNNKGWIMVFPNNLQHMTFINCNLDNVKLTKPGWVTFECSERNFKVKKGNQGEDLGDWLIDEQGNFIEPI